MEYYTKQFKSITEFTRYLENTPFNKHFEPEHRRHSTREDFNWYQTHTYEEAQDLFRNGWDYGIKKLNTKFQTSKQLLNGTKRKCIPGVVGHAPIVPLYLAGVPTNMLQQIQVRCKSKVVDITKSICYNVRVESDTIIAESVKALQVVQLLESQGYRVNLNVAFVSVERNRTIGCSIRIKGANEKLNISKLAFPMVHPSMLRRMIFRFIEVFEHTTADYIGSYGRPLESEMAKAFPGTIVLPAIWSKRVEDIKSIDDLVGRA